MDAKEVLRLFEIFDQGVADKRFRFHMRLRQMIFDMINSPAEPLLALHESQRAEKIPGWDAFWVKVIWLWEEKTARLSWTNNARPDYEDENSKLLFAMLNKYAAEMTPEDRHWICNLLDSSSSLPTAQDFDRRWPSSSYLGQCSEAIHKEAVHIWRKIHSSLRSLSISFKYKKDGPLLRPKSKTVRYASQEPELTNSDPDVDLTPLSDDHRPLLLDRAEQAFTSDELPPFAIRSYNPAKMFRPVVVSTKDGSRPDRPTQATLILRPWGAKAGHYTLDINSQRVIVKAFVGGSKGSGKYRQWLGDNIFHELPLAYAWLQSDNEALNKVSAGQSITTIAEPKIVIKRKRNSEPFFQPRPRDMTGDIPSQKKVTSPIQQGLPRIISKPHKHNEPIPTPSEHSKNRISLPSRLTSPPDTPTTIAKPDTTTAASASPEKHQQPSPSPQPTHPHQDTPTINANPETNTTPSLIDERQQQRTWMQIRTGTTVSTISTKLGKCNSIAAFVSLVCTACGLTADSIDRFEVTCKWMSDDDFSKHQTLF